MCGASLSLAIRYTLIKFSSSFLFTQFHNGKVNKSGNNNNHSFVNTKMNSKIGISFHLRESDMFLLLLIAEMHFYRCLFRAILRVDAFLSEINPLSALRAWRLEIQLQLCTTTTTLDRQIRVCNKTHLATRIFQWFEAAGMKSYSCYATKSISICSAHTHMPYAVPCRVNNIHFIHTWRTQYTNIKFSIPKPMRNTATSFRSSSPLNVSITYLVSSTKPLHNIIIYIRFKMNGEKCRVTQQE